MRKIRVIVLSYVPHYNRQGVDLSRALRKAGLDVRLYQLDGQTDAVTREYGVRWTRPHGIFSKFHVLWNIIKFIVPSWWRRKDIVICVGRPILVVGAIYRRLFGCQFVYYALEYSSLGRSDRWAIRQTTGYIDVEVNRCARVRKDYGLTVPYMVMQNLPPLHERVIGGRLRAYLRKRFDLPADVRVVIYAGSYQSYACLEEIVAASSRFPEGVDLVLMAYNLPEEVKMAAPKNCLIIPPVTGVEFYDWLADADCALLPYEDDADFNVRNCSPQKLFDCYVAGTPFVASDRPIIRETLACFPRAGRLVDFRQANEILEGVAACLEADNRVSSKMRELHKTKFNYNVMAEQLVSFVSAGLNQDET